MLGIRTHQMLEKPEAQKPQNFPDSNFAQKNSGQCAETVSRVKPKKARYHVIYFHFLFTFTATTML